MSRTRDWFLHDGWFEHGGTSEDERASTGIINDSDSMSRLADRALAVRATPRNTLRIDAGIEITVCVGVRNRLDLGTADEAR